MHLNGDLGERGHAHPGDLALLPLLDAINVAVGGHAGDVAAARHLADAALEHGVAVTLHCAYPDREHFGRRELAIPWPELRASLENQRAVLPEVDAVKFHGALYHRADADDDFAATVADWLAEAGIATVFTPPGGALHRRAPERGLAVRREGFADRRYVLRDGRPVLMPRGRENAVIGDPDAAVAQVARAVEDGLLAVYDVDGRTREVAFACDTWCIHSDSPAAPATAEALRAWIDRRC